MLHCNVRRLLILDKSQICSFTANDFDTPAQVNQPLLLHASSGALIIVSPNTQERIQIHPLSCDRL